MALYMLWLIDWLIDLLIDWLNTLKQNKLQRNYLLRVWAVLVEQAGAVGKKHKESAETYGRPEDPRDQGPRTDDTRYSVTTRRPARPGTWHWWRAELRAATSSERTLGVRRPADYDDGAGGGDDRCASVAQETTRLWSEHPHTSWRYSTDTANRRWRSQVAAVVVVAAAAAASSDTLHRFSCNCDATWLHWRVSKIVPTSFRP